MKKEYTYRNKHEMMTQPTTLINLLSVKELRKLEVKHWYTVEIVCIYENLALAWASIIEKNFSLLGVGEGEDSPIMLKEAVNVFKFYASGSRYCHGLLATMELKSRHNLISRLFNSVVPCKDEISFEVYMNDEAMDRIVFAMARKKDVKTMHKELRNLQRFGGMVPIPGGRKWVSEELAVMITDLVLDKEVLRELTDCHSISLYALASLVTSNDAILLCWFLVTSHRKVWEVFYTNAFSGSVHPGEHRKMLLFKFALPDAEHMDDTVRLVALIPYYVDLVGRYKLSSQADATIHEMRKQGPNAPVGSIKNSNKTKSIGQVYFPFVSDSQITE